jgi:hypothetical protein
VDRFRVSGEEDEEDDENVAGLASAMSVGVNSCESPSPAATMPVAAATADDEEDAPAR